MNAEAPCRQRTHRDTPCPACGYDLRGLTSARCPECGGGISPTELAAAVEHRTLVRACWGGFAYSLGVIGAVAAAIVAFSRDPFAILALWLPGVFFMVWVALFMLWIAAGWSLREGRGQLGLQVMTGLAWLIGTLLLGLMFLLLILAP